MTDIFQWVFIALLFFVPPVFLVLLGLHKVYMMTVFRRGRNPFSRICRRCGQQQDMHCWSWSSPGYGWWEDMQDIPDENCRCHKFSTHKDLMWIVSL
jgi:hypothetical protein